jgi:hypothetical protein
MKLLVSGLMDTDAQSAHRGSLRAAHRVNWTSEVLRANSLECESSHVAAHWGAEILRPYNWSAAAHPNFYNYVVNQMPMVTQVPVIVRAMRTHGFLDLHSFQAALGISAKPLLVLHGNLHDENGVRCLGYTPPNPPVKLADNFVPPPNCIVLDRGLANKFQTRDGPELVRTSDDPATNRMVIRAGVTILHELCHWGDWRAHGRFTDSKGSDPTSSEHGEDFEAEVYNAIIS